MPKQYNLIKVINKINTMNTFKKISSALTTVGTSVLALTAYAQGQIPPYQSVQVGTVTDLLNKFGTAIGYFATLIMIIAVAMILYAAFKFITAGDDEEAVGSARKILTWGVVGLIVAFLAYSFPTIVRTLVQ